MYYKVRARGDKSWRAVVRAATGPMTAEGVLHKRPLWISGHIVWCFRDLGLQIKMSNGRVYLPDYFIKIAMKEL